MQELLWQLSRGVDSSAFQHHLYGRSPFLELCILNLAEIDTSNFAGKMMHRDNLMTSDISSAILSDPFRSTKKRDLGLDTVVPFDSLIAK